MNKVGFKALGTNLLLEAPIVEEKTKSGVILPESIREESKLNQNQFLKVISVGDDVKGIKKGDSVMLRAGKHETINLNNKEYLIVYQGVIIGKKL